MPDPRHCDEYIDDPLSPPCLRDFLEFNRRPAILKRGRSPALFATLLRDVVGERFLPPKLVPFTLTSGSRVRVVMASRFGDVGITDRLGDDHGYVARVHIADLIDFSDAPLLRIISLSAQKEMAELGLSVPSSIATTAPPDQFSEPGICVCGLASNHSPWASTNVHTTCSICGVEIVHRPDIPAHLTKICLPCAAETLDDPLIKAAAANMRSKN